MRVFFHLNNSLNNKWFNFKIPSWNICTITPFLTCFLTGHLKLIMLEFYHVLTKGMHLAYNSTNLPNLLIIFPNFLHNTSYMTWTTPSVILHCVCTHPINLMGIHLLHCVHGNQHTKTMMQFTTLLSPLHEMLVSTWKKNNYMCFFQPHSTPFINESTLCLPKMTFAPCSTLSLLTQRKQIYFPNLV